jgi:hypothetical protein
VGEAVRPRFGGVPRNAASSRRSYSRRPWADGRRRIARRRAGIGGGIVRGARYSRNDRQGTRTAMSQTPSDATVEPDAGPTRPAWLPWLGWTWVVLLAAAAASVLLGWDDLRLALDVQRHFR